jgi:Ca-activated chloride channel homolog
VQPGQVKAILPDAAVPRVEVTGPTGRKEALTRGGTQFLYNNTEWVGTYRAAWPGGGRGFAVNLLDADESNLQPRDAIQIGAQSVAAGQVRRQTYDTWKWVALAALVLLVLEWAVYHRRVFF